MSQYPAALARRRRRGGAFSPFGLFADGSQGVWYDPSDLSTLFQDVAGTTPVTDVEQPVRLMLDKSRGALGNLGPELVVNGTFDTDVNGWTTPGANTTLTWENGAARVVVNPAAFGGIFSSNFTTVVGRTYRLTVTLSDLTGNAASIAAQTSAGSNISSIPNLSNGTWTLYFAATTTSSRIFIGNTNSATSSRLIDNVSVREIPGSHATASADARRPVLSARVNLLQRTEEFDNAAWAKANSPVVTENAAIAPNGTLTASRLQASAGTFTSAPNLRQDIANTDTRTLSLYAKAGTFSKIKINPRSFGGAGFIGVDLLTGQSTFATSVPPIASSVVDVGNGWWRISITTTSSGTVQTFRIALTDNFAATDNDGGTYTGTENVFIWGADLRVTNDGVGLPVYQRVTTSTDYDTAGFPRYLRFDGTDDCLLTGNVNFTATDKMTVCAGVRKLSDAAAAIVCELSASASSNNGTFFVAAPATAGANFGVFSRGTVSASQINSGFVAPITRVVGLIGDIAGPVTALRVNASEIARNTNTQGTGNYGTYPLFIGARNNSDLRFNGRLHQLVVVGKLLDATTLTQLETFTNQRTAAY